KLPAAATKSNLSWRVELLPYLDHVDLYQEFKLDEPWDSEHNKPLIAKMPPIYMGPPGTEPGKTYFQVIVGPGTPFENGKDNRLQEIKDGTSNTLLVVDGARPVIWTQPDDLAFGPDTTPMVGGLMPNVFLAGFADGSVRPLPRNLEMGLLR